MLVSSPTDFCSVALSLSSAPVFLTAGKSTLLNLVMGVLQPTAGTEYRHHNLRLSFFTQHHVDSLDLGVTPLQHMTTSFADKKEFELRAQLGRFGEPWNV